METNTILEKQRFLVIGAGLPRTGTMSLMQALEMILPGKCHHMVQAMQFHNEEWRDILNGKMTDEEFRSFFLSNYVAAVDAPFCFVYERAMKIFPDAKVILTVRDPEAWLKSVKETVLYSTYFDIPYTIFGMLGLFSSYLGKSPTMLFNALSSNSENRKLKNAIFRNGGVEHFNKWVQDVEGNVPQEKLLKFHVKEGWGPLCKFLNVPQPDAPFPNCNNTAQFKERTATRRRRSWLLLYEIITIPLLLYASYKISQK